MSCVHATNKHIAEIIPSLTIIVLQLLRYPWDRIQTQMPPLPLLTPQPIPIIGHHPHLREQSRHRIKRHAVQGRDCLYRIRAQKAKRLRVGLTGWSPASPWWCLRDTETTPWDQKTIQRQRPASGFAQEVKDPSEDTQTRTQTQTH
jgi:hypothetical protein